MKTWAITMGIGAAVGAVAILMMPKANPTRQVAEKAADKIEDAANKLTCKMTQTMN